MPIDFKLTKVSLQTTEHMESITLHNLYLTCSCDDRYKLQSTRKKLKIASLCMYLGHNTNQQLGTIPFLLAFDDPFRFSPGGVTMIMSLSVVRQSVLLQLGTA